MLIYIPIEATIFCYTNTFWEYTKVYKNNNSSGYHLLSAYEVPGTKLGAYGYSLLRLFYISNSRSCCAHFTDKETEAAKQ